MDTLRSGGIDAAYQVLVDLLGHEGDHGRRRLGNVHQGGVEGHVGVDLILLHALGPEPLSAAAHVPVAHVVHEILEGSCRLRDPVVGKVIVHCLDHRIQLGQKPLIHHR